jgi:hypothetical protein
MPKRRKNDDVTFIAQYENGTEEYFAVDRFTLRNGDAIARVIAGEWQRGGRLPPGKIVKIRRVL